MKLVYAMLFLFFTFTEILKHLKRSS